MLKKEKMTLGGTGNVGQYSISVAYSPWKTDKPKTINADTKKGKKTLRPIINPIFEKCAILTEDTFWKSTFSECARGRFPRGYSFKNNLITHKKGNKITS